MGEKSTFEVFIASGVISPTKGTFCAQASADLAPSVKGTERSVFRCLQERWFAKDACIGQRLFPSHISAGSLPCPVENPPFESNLSVDIVLQ